jgi:hypothetical protein
MTIPLPSASSTDDTALLTPDDEPGVGLWRAAWRRLRRNPTAIAGAVIVLFFVLVAILAPLLTPYQPGSAQWSGQVTPSSVPGPSADHLLGLDRFGSDLLTQLVYGARQSLVYGVVATALGVTLGTMLGALAMQYAAGGVMASGAMNLWAAAAPLGMAVMWRGRRLALWLGLFAGLVAAEMALEHLLPPSVPELPAWLPPALMVVNLCGRGDKDIFTVGKILGMEL